MTLSYVLPTGIQTFVMTLEGAAVALAAQGHLLALVWHAGMPANPDDQCLRYAVYDVSQQQQVRCRQKNNVLPKLLNVSVKLGMMLAVACVVTSLQACAQSCQVTRINCQGKHL